MFTSIHFLLLIAVLCNHSFQTNPNTVTNLSKHYYQLTFAQCRSFYFLYIFRFYKNDDQNNNVHVDTGNTWLPPGKTTIVVNASITYDSVTGAAAFGRLAGRNMEKMPLKVDVRSQIPIVLFLFPFPIYFIFPDGKYFIKKLKKNEKCSIIVFTTIDCNYRSCNYYDLIFLLMSFIES